MANRFRLPHLEIFWAVIRTGSQREAASLLGLSQPAVSKLLRHVEDQVGFPLFRRAKGRLIPTPEARIFFEAVDDIFGRVDAAGRLVRDLKRRFSGQISIVSVPALAATFVPEAISHFLREQSEVRVGLMGLPTAQVIDRVLNKEAHVGLLYGPIETTAVEAVTLCTAHIVCAVPKGHRLASSPFLTPADLAGEPLISASYMPKWGQLVENAFEEAEAQLNIIVNCANSDLAYRMAAEGAGIAVVPVVPWRGMDIRPIVLRRFRPAISFPVLAVHNRIEPLGQLVSSLIGWLGALTRNYAWDASVAKLPGRDAELGEADNS